MRKLTLSLVLGILSVNLSGPCVAADTGKNLIGRKVPAFSLKDYRGKIHSLSDFNDAKLLVIGFLGTECPLAKLYGPRLAKIAKEYEPEKVAFIGINSNVQDSITEIAAYARIHKIEFPLLKDLGNKVADQIQAQRTPEVFVLDEKRIIRYHGRVDDQYGVGYVRDEVKREDLKVALDELLAGKEVSTPTTEAPGCFIGRIQKPKADSKITYSKHIAHILQKRCVECHRKGEIAPFSLTNYEEVVGWAETIAEVVRDRRMPPWHANPKYGKYANDRSLSKKEMDQIFAWVDNGAPKGNPKHLPAPRKFVSGWHMHRPPDRIIPITDQPVKIQATGAVRYKYYVVDPGFTEDKWFDAAQVLPGNHAVLHHVLVFAVQGKSIGKALRKIGGGRDSFLVGYVPGMRARRYPQGMAMRIPAGSRLVFQVHYTPIGTVQYDQSNLGLCFVDPKTVKKEILIWSASNQFVHLPPGMENRKAGATSGFMPKSELLAFMPHMHLRGKSFRYEIIYPDKKKEIILDVPQFDFNWQTTYRLAKGKPLPKGTRIHCTAHYDNSDNNLINPNSKARVRWGDQTWEEMMIGYFAYAVDVDPKNPNSKANHTSWSRPEKAKMLANQLVNQNDTNNDGKVGRNEIPFQFFFAFARIDRNEDGYLTPAEIATAFEAYRKK